MPYRELALIQPEKKKFSLSDIREKTACFFGFHKWTFPIVDMANRENGGKVFYYDLSSVLCVRCRKLTSSYRAFWHDKDFANFCSEWEEEIRNTQDLIIYEPSYLFKIPKESLPSWYREWNEGDG